MRMNLGTRKARTWVVIAGAMLVVLFATSLGRSSASSEKAQKAWTAYIQAQRQYQQELADFLVSRRPDLKELILVNRDLQLALIERRSLEFRHLLATHPERIVTNQGISKFSNYDWTDEDGKDLRSTTPDYEAAINHVKALQRRSDGDSHWDALRAANRALAKKVDYQKIYDRFGHRTEAAEKLLK
jgi:hypothetical protein